MNQEGAPGGTLTIYGAHPQWSDAANSPWQNLANLAAKGQAHQTGQALYIYGYQISRGRTSLVDNQCQIQMSLQFLRHKRPALSGGPDCLPDLL